MQNIVYSIEFLNGGFFGSGEEGEFTNFSFAHFAPIVLTILAIFIIKMNVEKIRNWKYENDFRFFFGLFLLLLGMSYYWRLLFAGPSNYTNSVTFTTELPLQACEITLLIVSIALMKKSKNFFQAGFVLVISTTLPSLVLPGLVLYTCGPTRFRYYQFFGMHLLPIVASFYIMFVDELDVKRKFILVDWIILIVLFTICAYLNSVLKDYGFVESYLYMSTIKELAIPEFLKTYFGLSIVYSLFFLITANISYFIYSKLKSIKHV